MSGAKSARPNALLIHWQGISQPRCGLDGLLDVVEQLQDVALPASDWERQILPARVADFRPSNPCAPSAKSCGKAREVWALTVAVTIINISL